MHIVVFLYSFLDLNQSLCQMRLSGLDAKQAQIFHCLQISVPQVLEAEVGSTVGPPFWSPEIHGVNNCLLMDM